MKTHSFKPGIVLDNTSLIPLREQIAESFRKNIARYRPEPGCRIVSENILSKELEIHRKTVHQAYEILIAEGFFVHSPTRGVQIAPGAGELCRKPFPSIAFVMPYTMTEQLGYFNRHGYELCAGIIDRAAELGCAVNILPIPAGDIGDDELDVWLENSVMRNVGIIDLGPRPEGSMKAMEKLLKAPLPHVLLSAESTFPGISTLRPDYESVYDQVIKKVSELGHRCMVCVDYENVENHYFHDSSYLRIRIAGAAAEKYGMSRRELSISKDVPELEAYARLAEEIMKLTPRPTVALCHNDRVGVNLKKALEERGWSIPGDLSILGYDRMEPGMAGCDHSRMELGRTAVEMILEMDKNWKFGEFRNQVVPCVFYEDASLGALH